MIEIISHKRLFWSVFFISCYTGLGLYFILELHQVILGFAFMIIMYPCPVSFFIANFQRKRAYCEFCGTVKPVYRANHQYYNMHGRPSHKGNVCKDCYERDMEADDFR